MRQVLLCIAILGCGTAAFTAEKPLPTCGVIADRAAGPDVSPLVALLEVHLAQSGHVALVERNQVDRVVREQQLQLMFVPEAVDKRAALGRLLKADVLVLLRANDKPQPHVRVVICETRQGLRLCARPVPLSGDPKADCAAVASLVDYAIALHAQGIRDVVAVPPFVNRSLTYEAEHLKSVYAKLVEDLAILRPGVLAVELAEANAISREIALSASASAQRPLPLYVMGEYRQEGADTQARQTICLTLMRGQKQLDAAKAENLPSREATAFVRQAVSGMLEKSLGKAAPPDPATESRQLVERGQAFLRTGDWPEAAALLEAGLLLEERHPEWHHRAAFALQRMARDLQQRDRGIFTENTERAIACFRASLPHLEAFFTNSVLMKQPHEMTSEGGEIQVRWVWGNWQRRLIAEMGERAVRAADQLDQQCQTLLTKVLERKAADKVQDTTALFAERGFFRPLNYGAPLPWRLEELDRRLAFLRQFSYLKDPAVCSRLVAAAAACDDLAPDDPDYTAFLTQAEAIDNGAIKLAVSRQRQAAQEQAAADLARNKALAGQGRQPRLGSANRPSARLVPVELYVRSSSGRDVPRRFNITRWLPLLGGVDLVCGEAQVYVLRQQGQLVPLGIVRLEEQAPPVFDGRLAWIASGLPQPALSAFDPSADGRVVRFTEADGLPAVRRAHIAALEAGKVVVAGFFGRSFCGIAGLDPQTGAKSFKILYEARESYDDTSLEDRRSLAVATEIDFLRVLVRPAAPGGKPIRKAFIGRSTEARPVLLDLDTSAAQVLPYRILESEILAAADGVMYWVGIREKGLCLLRAALPDMKEEVLATGLPRPEDGRVQNWQAYVPELKGRPVDDENGPPDLGEAFLSEKHAVGVFRTSQYGWVMPTRGGRVFQVLPDRAAAPASPQTGAQAGPQRPTGGA